MVRATYQKRISALILGIRPSASHIYGSTERTPADNLTMVGIEAWLLGLRQLQTDMAKEPSLQGGDLWVMDWVAKELERENGRWSDASTMLELLAIALGPASSDPTAGPRGRSFWTQWQRNIDHLCTLMGTGAAAPTPDTAELLTHAVSLVQQHNGPDAIIANLTQALHELGPVGRGPAAFRPLTSAVERLQFSTILAAVYDDEPTCTAAMARLLEQRPPSPACAAESSGRRRARGWRYRSTIGH